MSMQKCNDTFGNQTRDLPACSVVPQPTAPPRALSIDGRLKNMEQEHVEMEVLGKKSIPVRSPLFWGFYAAKNDSLLPTFRLPGCPETSVRN